MVGSIRQAVGSVWQAVGSVWQAVGSIRQAVGSVWQAVGSSRQVVGSVWQAVGSIRQAVGSSWQVVGVRGKVEILRGYRSLASWVVVVTAFVPPFYPCKPMDTKQQNKLTMLQTVLTFLAGDGQPLAAIKRIGTAADALQALVDALHATSSRQDTPTTGLTRSRDEVKAEAAGKAEVLRLLAVALTDDATLRASLKQPLSKAVRGKDDDYLTYLAVVAAAIGTLPKDDLKESGYDPAVLATLQADLTELTTTQGAARQVQVGTSTATEQLPDLFEQVDALLAERLDPLVRAQALARPTEVAEYDKARRIMRTAATHGPRFAGVALAGTPVLVLDRRVAGLPAPTLANRSTKGLRLRYYTAGAPTATHAAGQGLVLKPRAEAHLESYDKLGPDPDAPYLLVVLEGVDGEGKWRVK